MDFWSRILAHNPLSSGSSRKDLAKDPLRRRQRFEKDYSQLLQIWRNSSNLANDEEAGEKIEIRLQELTNLLSDESRRPLPHPCIAFAASKQIYVPIGKIATTSYNEWIIKEAVLFFATLIESEEEAFVENEVFSASLTNLLVRITGHNSIRLGPDTEIRVVELAFNITTKIRLEPDILPAWFKTGGQRELPSEKLQQDGREKFAGKTQKQDFPLFYLLVDYIHHDGKVGDFARTGLLYIIEAASNSVALEQWIVESDLSTLMATGLGALYSQLSRKLVIDHPDVDLPAVLAFSDYQHPKSSFEVISSCSFEFQAHLDTFLSHLLFWQDVLNHCKSVEVKSTLLEHFQVIFLQQLLYPSLLESSDIDGGSSVAVLTYLRRILESLDHPDMINLILHYLLALPDMVPSAHESSRNSVSAARKRKSMDLATMMAAKAELTADPLLFNLVDLVLACLRSHSTQTILVTLQLVSTILKRHHRYAVTTLLHTVGVHDQSSSRTSGAHQQEVEFLMALAGVIGGQDNFDEVYESVLKDTTVRVEGHPCSLKLVAPKTSTNNHKLPAIPDSLPGAPRDVRSHTLRADDPLLNLMLDRLETFFVNPVEVNLSLTESIFDLAVCGFMHVEGWLLRDPHKYVYEPTDGEIDLAAALSSPIAATAPDSDFPEVEEQKKLQAMTQCRRRPKWAPSSLPRLLSVLQTLLDEFASYRETIPRFDDLLQQRRESFQTAEGTLQTPAAAPRNKNRGQSATSSSTPALERTSQEESRSSSPARPTNVFEGFAQRILSEFGTPTRSGSPRGRKEPSRATPSEQHGKFATPIPIVAPRDHSAAGYDTPTKGGSGLARSYSPGSAAAFGATGQRNSGSHDGRNDAVASQMKAFLAIDQSILARRVGIPDAKRSEGADQIEPIPLRFNKSPVPAAETLGGASAEADDAPALAEAESAAPLSEETTPTPPDEKTASVSHVLTNTLILQSFLFELAALIQVRAGVFDEVRYV